MDDARIAHLVINHLSRTLSEKEKEELDVWIGGSPQKRRFVDKQLNPEEIMIYIEALVGMDKRSMYNEFLEKIREMKPVRQPSSASRQQMISSGYPIYRNGLDKVNLGRWAAIMMIVLSFPFTKLTLNQSLPYLLSQIRESMSSTLQLDRDSVIVLGPHLEEGKLLQVGKWLISKRGQRYIDYREANQTIEKDSLIKNFYTILSIPKDSSAWQVHLPDGTKVMLDPGSTLALTMHPTEGPAAQRNIRLTGTGIIEVAPNATTPFRVETPLGKMMALGTLFSIRTHTEEDKIDVALYDGKLAIDNGRKTLTLLPGQQATLSTRNQIDTSKAPGLHTVTWESERFDFSRQTLPEAMERVRAWYKMRGVKYEKGVDMVTVGKLGGSIGRDLSLDELFTIVEKAAPLHFKETKDSIIHVYNK